MIKLNVWKHTTKTLRGQLQEDIIKLNVWKHTTKTLRGQLWEDSTTKAFTRTT